MENLTAHITLFSDISRELRVQIFSYCTKKDLFNFLHSGPSALKILDLSLLPDIFIPKYRYFPFSAFIRIDKTVSADRPREKWWETKIVAICLDKKEDRNRVESQLPLCLALRDLRISSEHIQEGKAPSLKGCSGLQEIDLSGCEEMSDDGLISLAKECPGLKTVMLSGNTISDRGPVSDRGLEGLAKGCSLLERIEIDHSDQFTVKGLEALGKGCPQMKTVKLKTCTQIGDSELIAIAETYSRLSDIEVSQGKELTDSGLKALFDGCPELVNIYLSWNDKITFENFKTADKEYFQFRNLKLFYCGGITDEGFEAFVKKCPHLETVDLSGYHKIEGMGIQALENCPLLRELHVEKAVTDEILMALGSKCPQIANVNLEVVGLGWTGFDES